MVMVVENITNELNANLTGGIGFLDVGFEDTDLTSQYTTELMKSVSSSTGIPFYRVKEILDCYNKYIYSSVVSGLYPYVDYLGLARFTVKPLTSDELEGGVGEVVPLLSPSKFSPLGYQFTIVSKECGVELEIVRSVLLRFIEVVKNELLSNNTVVIYGIIKFSLSISGRVRCKSSSKFASVNLMPYSIKVRSSVSPYWQYEYKKLNS